MAEAPILPCTSCGASTRHVGVSVLDFPGTVTRKTLAAGPCSRCRWEAQKAGVKVSVREPKRLNGRVAIAMTPLTDDEQLVLRAVERECGDDAAEVAALLGLIRKEVPA